MRMWKAFFLLRTRRSSQQEALLCDIGYNVRRHKHYNVNDKIL